MYKIPEINFHISLIQLYTKYWTLSVSKEVILDAKIGRAIHERYGLKFVSQRESFVTRDLALVDF